MFIEVNNHEKRVQRCWGKTSGDDSVFHPALFHMLDVGNVASALLEQGTSRWRSVLADAFEDNTDSTSKWLPWVVSLHDVGKISADFQILNRGQVERLKREGFVLDGSGSKESVAHQVISQVFIEDILGERPQELNESLASVIAESLGGHHGRYVHPGVDLKKARNRLRGEPPEWNSLRETAESLLRRNFLDLPAASLPQPRNISKAIMALTGYVILCDWLGSDERYFRPEAGMAFEEYIHLSRARAEKAVSSSGLTRTTVSAAPSHVEMLFADMKPLRSLQLAVDSIPDELLAKPTLTVIEAPTGEGKTEAALALARRIASNSGSDEMYYALPTMATSNQMYARLQRHVHERLGLGVSVKLVHGQAFMVEEDLRNEIEGICPLENGGAENGSEAITWFNSKKRALLAPFGVGTIDQAELAALNVKHTALRMMGLAGKVVIVDEVHAYDTYMTTIIERLLSWLATLNSSVILLSATLPTGKRRRLIQAYKADAQLAKSCESAYPSLVVVGADETHCQTPGVWQPERVIEVKALALGDKESKQKAEWLVNAIAQGGCVCWITNTVRRAQRLFEHLLGIAPGETDLWLIHSQFPLEERQRRESGLCDRFGPKGNRPTRAIIVGTQILEQSLDLDFDLMVSDLAPVDLLLQRAGRLHRHDRQRPTAHSAPRLFVNMEYDGNGQLRIGTDRTIYAAYIMRKTFEELRGRGRISLPQDYRVLVEAVYTDEPPPEDSSFYDDWLKLQGEQQSAEHEARQRLLPAPDADESFAQKAAMKVTFEEDENRADWIVAQTRLGERSLNVIPLERNANEITIHSSARISVNEPTTRQIEREILIRQLRISHSTAMEAIEQAEAAEPTILFRKSALLKGYMPLWLSRGEACLQTERRKLTFKLDPHLGLVIQERGKQSETT
jgi:CRISPR-associated endonuclease/helicase Cas3